MARISDDIGERMREIEGDREGLLRDGIQAIRVVQDCDRQFESIGNGYGLIPLRTLSQKTPIANTKFADEKTKKRKEKIKNEKQRERERKRNRKR